MYWMSATCAGWFARAGSTLSVRSRRPLAIGGDQLAIKIGEAFAQIALVQFDAAQINRGGRDRSMAQQHLHDLERVEIGIGAGLDLKAGQHRSEEHTSELPSLMRNSYAVFCLKKKTTTTRYDHI